MKAPADTQLDRLEARIGWLLHGGVVASSVCLTVGLVLTLVGNAAALANTMLVVGLMILLVTPVTRVVASVIEYVREGDWLFVTLTSGVLLVLAGSVVAAFWQ